MQASIAIVTVAGKRVEMTEQVIEKINQALSTCPVGGEYSDSAIKRHQRLRLVPTLEIKAVIDTLPDTA